jgi:hypothetical protein
MPAGPIALRAALLALGVFIAAPENAGAQSYPDRAVKIVVPIGPAGSYDIVGRLLADQLSKRLGQSFVVENRPGAGTIVGTQAVINSPPDGYTLLVGGLSNIVFNAGLYQKLPYDPLNDLVPVALVFNISYTLVGYKDLPYSSPQDVIAAAKANPGGLKLANAGTGTGQHIMGAAFMKLTGTIPGSALSRIGGGLSRSAGRARRPVRRLDAGGAALHQVRPSQGHRDPVVEAKRANSRRADHDRSRRSQSRDRFLDRLVRPRQNPAGRDRPSATGDRPGASRAQAALRAERRRSHRARA